MKKNLKELFLNNLIVLLILIFSVVFGIISNLGELDSLGYPGLSISIVILLIGALLYSIRIIRKSIKIESNKSRLYYIIGSHLLLLITIFIIGKELYDATYYLIAFLIIILTYFISYVIIKNK